MQPSAAQIYAVLAAIRSYVRGQRCGTCTVCSKAWRVCELSCCPEDWDEAVLREIAQTMAHGDQVNLFTAIQS
jgi:hypothetical protein